MYYKVVENKKPKCPKKQKARRKRRFVLFTVLLLISVFSLILMYNFMCAKPTIIAFAQASVMSKTTEAINTVVYREMTSGFNYKELIDIEKNTSGDIVYISSNTVLINRLAKLTAINVGNSLAKLSQIGVAIPWGTLTGFAILTGKGSAVKLTVNPVSQTLCYFSSNFESAGINQTIHQIYLNVEVNMQVIIPTSRENFKTIVPVLVCENIVVGKVPDTYLNGSILGSVQTA